MLCGSVWAEELGPPASSAASASFFCRYSYCATKPAGTFNGAVPVPGPTADQFQALSGGMQQTDIGLGDVHYIHGVGPITLARGRSADVWLPSSRGTTAT